MTQDEFNDLLTLTQEKADQVKAWGYEHINAIEGDDLVYVRSVMTAHFERVYVSPVTVIIEQHNPITLRLLVDALSTISYDSLRYELIFKPSITAYQVTMREIQKNKSKRSDTPITN